MRKFPHTLILTALILLGILALPSQAEVIISEFVAANESGLQDEDGEYSDWAELYNDGATPVDLAGWFLTDDAGAPAKWTFPSVTLGPKAFLIVWASSKNRVQPNQPLHTNFKLSAGGGYLALTRPGGTIASQYDQYPAQYPDKPYGIGQTVAASPLVSSTSALRWLVPTGPTPNAGTWTLPAYSDNGWGMGTNGVGFESTVPGWQFRTYYSNVDMPSLAEAEATIANSSRQSSLRVANHPVVNFDNSGSPGHYGGESPPSWLAAPDQDRFAVEAIGLVTIPTAGPYTLGIMSDDGCIIQVRASGGSWVTVASFAGLRGMGDTLGTYQFPAAGDYEVRAMMFENYGGGGGEVFAKAGTWSSWDAGFRLIGAADGLAVKSLAVAAGSSGYLAHVGTNLLSVMNGVTPQRSSAYVRYRFTNPGGLTSLTLPVRYDDGFVAYLNGTEVARRNAPAGAPAHDSVAAADRPSSQAIVPEHIDLTSQLGLLAAGNANVLAVHAMNLAAGNGDFLLKAELAQYNVAAATTPAYFLTPTPGGFNTAAVYNKVAPVVASVGRGFYTATQSVTLTCGTPASTIRYTFDGSLPTLSSPASALYSGPISVSATATLRYAAFRSGFDPSDSGTQTYLFPASVLTQSPTGAPPVINNPAGAANTQTTWPLGPINGQVLDYGMDPDVVNNPTYSATLVNDLRAIPTFSIVTDLANLFDPASGIYTNPSQDSIAWERPCSLELIYPDGKTGFQANCGIRLRGGFSRSPENPKHAFRFFFRDEYGPGRLRFPLFGDDATAATDFDKFDLRTFQNYSWSFGGDGNGIFMRDQVARDMQLAAGQVSSHGDYYHLYVNGQYWGIYNIDERPEAAFGATYFGGEKDDYDAVKIDPDNGYNVEATDGNLDAWFALWQLADSGLASTNTGAANNLTYQRLLGNNPDGVPNATYPILLDPLNLIDEMLIVFWGGNLDAPISNFIGNESPNNWFGFRHRGGLHGGFKFVLHDSEHTLLPWNVGVNRLGPWPAGSSALQGAAAFGKSNPQYIFQQAIHADEFRILFADRVYKHCYRGGILTPETARTLVDARAAQLDRAVVAESARWGDAKRAPTDPPLTRVDWLGAVDFVRGSFLPQRTAILLDQLRTQGWYPAIDPPVFSTRGGTVAPGSTVTLGFAAGTPAGSTIYYTLNGTDPRSQGGNVHPSAQGIGVATSLAINTSMAFRARVRNGATWSALEEVVFYVTQDFSALAITEINYRPPPVTGGDGFEFLELKNTGTSTLDLGGLAFTSGITYSFPAGTLLAPGAFRVLVANATQFAQRYPGLAIHGVFASGKLSDGGEGLTLSAPGGGVVIDVNYDNRAPWPAAADGSGFTVVPAGTTYNSSNGHFWRASAAIHGSPGADDPPSLIPAIRISEAFTSSAFPLVDSIEVHNPTGASVDIGHWWLTDNPDIPQKFRIPAGTTLNAGAYVAFTEAQFNSTPGVGASFSLSSNGDDLYLYSGNAAGNLTGYSHGFDFQAAELGVSFGRHVNSIGEETFPRQTSRTPGTANSGPLVGPIVISEIMYNPFAGYDEYIEIRNLTSSTQLLYDPARPANTWRVGGAAYVFPQNASVEPNGVALVVNIPVATFRSKYAIPAAVPIYGPFAGTLQDSGEMLSLEKPEVPYLEGAATIVPYAVMDAVRYNDKLPWPTAADGQGPALQRLVLASYADDPANWFGNGATPGAANAQNQPPAVTLTSPANNATFTLPSTITLQASASDAGGSVARVEFYIDGGKIGEDFTAPYAFNWVATGGIHVASAKVIDNNLTVTTSNPATLYITQAVAKGLRADYYSNRFLQTIAFTRIDAVVNFDDYSGTWVNFNGVGTDNFSVRWSGQFRAPTAGSYTFYTISDDGVRLFVDGVALINNFTNHGATEDVTPPLALAAGQLVTLTMEYFEDGGGAEARLLYSGPGIAKGVIPQSALYPNSTPIIITHPQGSTTEEGADPSLSVVASGMANTYQWRRNGVNVAGATAATLTLSGVLRAEAGSYSVLVANASGFAISNGAAINVTFTDTDGDGMQNSWETANGFNPNSATDAILDTDNDGRTNREEFLAGTDPRNAASLLTAKVARLPNNAGWSIAWLAQPKKGYTVQYKNSLADTAWTKLQDIPNQPAPARNVQVTDPSTATSRYYRVVTPTQ